MFLVQFVKNAIDFLSAPQYLVTGALIGLILAIHWAPMWSRKGGMVLFAISSRPASTPCRSSA